MHCLVLLSLAALASCAPVGEQESFISQVSDDDVRVKKAKEIMMFGNVQNKPKEKRSGPVMDKGGDVMAEEPIDLPSPPEVESPVGANAVAEVAQSNGEPSIAIPVEQETVESAGEPSESEAVEEAIEEDKPEVSEDALEQSPDESDVIDSTEDADDSTALVESEPDSDEEGFLNRVYGLGGESEENADADDDFMRQYLQMLPLSAYGPSSRWGSKSQSMPYQYYRRLRRGVNKPAVKGAAIKRGRRIKRDLWDDFNTEYDPYRGQFEEEYLPYAEEEEPEENDDLGYLLDILESSRAYDNQPDLEIPLESESDLGGYLYDDVPRYGEYVVPTKRQAGLSFVPGIKRGKPFFPYFREPYSHFRAFVPEKRGMRDYEQEYERLMQLAAALRDEQEYGYPYDFRDFGYRK